MSEEYKGRPEYKDLPKSRQMLVDAILGMMGESPEWHRSWKAADVPVSMTGRAYRGENNVSLTLAAITRGYDDPRWMTFNQMRNSGWKFRTGEDGKSMGKDAGICVSFFVLRDKKTKNEFDRDTIRGLPRDEQEKYMRDNVYPLRKTYVVFNASIIEGVPALARPQRDLAGKSEDAEAFLKFWDKNMTPIRYGGDRSVFLTKKNLIRLPQPGAFESANEFYGTAFHEISHSCQGFTRPGVELSTDMGSPEYRKDERSAEISAVFMTQRLCGAIDTKALRNSAAYLESWLLGESDEGKAFFDAVGEADKLSRYALDTWEKKTDEVAEDVAREARKTAESTMQASFFDGVPDGAPGVERKLKKEPEPARVNVRRPTEKGYDPKYPTSFRMGKDGVIPPEVYEAHMSVLIPGDRETLEGIFSKDPGFTAMYFGYDVNGSDARNAADTMRRLALNDLDKDTCVRIFNASVWKDMVTKDQCERMAADATGLVTEIREKLREYRDSFARGEKPAFKSTDRGAER